MARIYAPLYTKKRTQSRENYILYTFQVFILVINCVQNDVASEHADFLLANEISFWTSMISHDIILSVMYQYIGLFWDAQEFFCEDLPRSVLRCGLSLF